MVYICYEQNEFIWSRDFTEDIIYVTYFIQLTSEINDS